MANIKISQLSNAGLLNGSEFIPVVQGNATVKTTAQDIVNLLGLNYTPENVANKSTDITLSANSDTLYPSQKAIKAYVDGTIVSAIKDNGNWDASGNLFPNVNSQGQPITKGDLWYISVGGTLGGTLVLAGYSIRALVNNPAQNATNWGILNVGLGFVPENVANKSTDGTLSANSDTLYPSQKAVRTYVNNLSIPVPTLQQVTTAGATTTSNVVVNQVSTSSGASIQSSGRLVAKDIELQPTIGSSTDSVLFDSSLITGNKTYTLPNANGTLALLSSISATSPLSYNSGTGVISMVQASGSQNGYLSSANWTTFNNKQNALSGTGLVKSTAGTISYISGTSSQFIKGDGSLDSNSYVSISALSNYLALSGGTMNGSIYMQSYGIGSNTISIDFDFGGLYLQDSSSNKLTLLLSSGSNDTITFPAGTGTVALMGSSAYTASCEFEINSTSKGFLPPRMTESQRIGISSPATGLMVYQTNNTTGVYVFDGSIWRRLNWT